MKKFFVLALAFVSVIAWFVHANDVAWTSWELVSFNGATGVVGTLEFDETMMYSKFCNNVSQGYVYTASGLVASWAGMSTMMYCEGMPMVLEGAFFLSDTATPLELSGDVLTITASGSNEFVFNKVLPAICTMEYMPVCGTDWLTYGNACAAAAAKVTVQSEWECGIGDNCIQMFDGCNTCSREPGGEWACTKMYCETPQESYCMATTNDIDLTVWGDKDDYGCIGSAWYSWSQSQKECVRIWENTGATTFELAYDFAFNQGMTTMQTVETFRGSDFITRQEAAKMLVAFAEGAFDKTYASFPDVCNTPYTDESLFDETLKAFIYEACAHSMMKWAKGKFMPNHTLTKGEALTILMRTADGMQSEEDTSTWWMPYVTRANELKLLHIDSTDDFNNPITREELLVWAHTIFKNSVSQ